MAWAAIVAGALKGALAEDAKGAQQSSDMAGQAASRPSPAPPPPMEKTALNPSLSPVAPPPDISRMGLLAPPPPANAPPDLSKMGLMTPGAGGAGFGPMPSMSPPPAPGPSGPPPGANAPSLWDRKRMMGLLGGFMQGANGGY